MLTIREIKDKFIYPKIFFMTEAEYWRMQYFKLLYGEI